jgi:hypothetical protein
MDLRLLFSNMSCGVSTSLDSLHKPGQPLLAISFPTDVRSTNRHFFSDPQIQRICRCHTANTQIKQGDNKGNRKDLLIKYILVGPSVVKPFPRCLGSTLFSLDAGTRNSPYGPVPDFHPLKTLLVALITPCLQPYLLSMPGQDTRTFLSIKEKRKKEKRKTKDYTGGLDGSLEIESVRRVLQIFNQAPSPRLPLLATSSPSIGDAGMRNSTSTANPTL